MLEFCVMGDEKLKYELSVVFIFKLFVKKKYYIFLYIFFVDLDFFII